MPDLKLFLLGSPRVECAGEPVAIELRKALALLVYLSLTERSHSRDTLATLFWPELDQSRARAGLRYALNEYWTAYTHFIYTFNLGDSFAPGDLVRRRNAEPTSGDDMQFGAIIVGIMIRI